MKSTKHKIAASWIIATFLMIGLSSCEKNIFGPNSGTISGIIKDNNGKPIEGATVTADYTDGSQSGTLSASSNANGFYLLEKARLVENQLTVDASGFKSTSRVVILEQDNNDKTFDFEMKGAPVLASFDLSDPILDTSASASDTSSVFIVNVSDEYNSTSLTTYTVNALIANSNGQTEQIVKLTSTSSSSTFSISEVTFIYDQFANPDTYTISVEITDPDGNVNLVDEVTTLTIR